MLLAASLVAVAVAVAYRAGGRLPRRGGGEVTLLVSGMHCDGCAGGVASELRRLPGVERVEVSLANGTAVVAYDTNRVVAAQLVEAVKQAGFEGRVR